MTGNSKQVDLEKYAVFVDGVTSTPSQDANAFIYRLQYNFQY